MSSLGAAAPAGAILVLGSDRGGAAEGLLGGLERRGALPRVVQTCTAAMVEMARGDVRALVVVDPHSVELLPRLLAAVRRFYPQMPLWQFEPRRGGGQPGLSRITDAPPVPAAPAPHAGCGASDTEADRARERPVHSGDAVPNSVDASRDDLPPAALTPDELAVLLGPPATDAPDNWSGHAERRRP